MVWSVWPSPHLHVDGGGGERKTGCNGYQSDESHTFPCRNHSTRQKKKRARETPPAENSLQLKGKKNGGVNQSRDNVMLQNVRVPRGRGEGERGGQFVFQSALDVRRSIFFFCFFLGEGMTDRRQSHLDLSSLIALCG